MVMATGQPTTYMFRWKRKIFWSKVKVNGHRYDEDQDKMLLFFEEGGLREIKKWSDCELKLGIDWFAVTEHDIKETAGVA